MDAYKAKDETDDARMYRRWSVGFTRDEALHSPQVDLTAADTAPNKTASAKPWRRRLANLLMHWAEQLYQADSNGLQLRIEPKLPAQSNGAGHE